MKRTLIYFIGWLTIGIIIAIIKNQPEKPIAFGSSYDM